MNKDLVKIFEKYKSLYYRCERGATVHMEISERKELLMAINEAFDKKYSANIYCGGCVADMLRFGYTRYLKLKLDENI